jgi:hypothetical protein
MDVLIVTVFVSLILVIAGLVLFVTRLRQGDFEHGDRLSLLPLEDSERPVADPQGKPQEDPQTESQKNPEKLRVAE